MSAVKTRAKVLDPRQFGRVLEEVNQWAKNPVRDRVIFFLSFKAGLRVGEIAGLTWRNVTDAEGNIIAPPGNYDVPADIAKKGSGRAIPMHPELYKALVALAAQDWATLSPKQRLKVNIVRDTSGRPMRPNTLQRYISRAYEKIGFNGCSSHSGRRTFITSLAQAAGSHDCSLRDVQMLAGHRGIDTTEDYIVASDRVGQLVRSL